MALEVLVTRALGGVTVDVESNVTPSFRLYDSRDDRPSLLDALGVKTHFVVRRGDGSVLTEYGQAQPKNYVLAAALLVAAVAGVLILGAAVGRLLR